MLWIYIISVSPWQLKCSITGYDFTFNFSTIIFLIDSNRFSNAVYRICVVWVGEKLILKWLRWSKWNTLLVDFIREGAKSEETRLNFTGTQLNNFSNSLQFYTCSKKSDFKLRNEKQTIIFSNRIIKRQQQKYYDVIVICFIFCYC